MSSHSTSAAAPIHVDPTFEFDCPQHRDFDEPSDGEGDEWFDKTNDGVAATTLSEVLAADEDAAVNDNLAEEEAAETVESQPSSATPIKTEENIASDVAHEHSTHMAPAATEMTTSISGMGIDATSTASPVAESIPSPPRSLTPLHDASSEEINTIAHAAAETDTEVHALTMSLVQPPAIIQPLQAEEEAEEDSKSEQVDEQHEQEQENIPVPALSMLESFNAASENGAATCRAIPAVTPFKSKGVRSYQRPTAAYTARRAAAHKQTENAAPVAPNTARRYPMRSTTHTNASNNNIQKSANHEDITPKKRRWEELARPRTAAKPHLTDRATAADSNRPQTAVKAKIPASARNERGVTIPHSPAFNTRSRIRKENLKTSEELELERIKMEEMEMKKQRKIMEAKIAHLRSTGGQGQQNTGITVAHVRIPHVTQPEEFQFHTSKRAKHTHSTQQPFSMHDVNAQPATARGGKEKDVKEKVVHSNEPPSLTRPQPFNLLTTQRIRPTKLLPTEVLQQQETEEYLKSHGPFKARPFPSEIFQSGMELSGLPRVAKPKPTEASSPQLATKERACKRKQSVQATDMGEMDAIHVNESNKKSKREVSPTRHTAAAAAGPFMLETEIRGTKKREEFEHKLEEERAREAAARAFHARPIGASASMDGSSTARASISTPACIKRHAEAHAHLQAEWAAQQAAAKEAANFKARPMPKLDVPFAASRSNQPMTVPKTPLLTSTHRAEQRKEFDQMTARQMEERARTMEEERRAKEEAEERERAELRKSLIHHPLPLNKHLFEHALFAPKPSEAPLTVPESPMLRTKVRLGPAIKNNAANAAAAAAPANNGRVTARKSRRMERLIEEDEEQERQIQAEEQQQEQQAEQPPATISTSPLAMPTDAVAEEVQQPIPTTNSVSSPSPVDVSTVSSADGEGAAEMRALVQEMEADMPALKEE